MYSLGLVCLGQVGLTSFDHRDLPFQVDASPGVKSHRGDSSPFLPVFELLRGATYHLGSWHNENYFSAWDLLTPGPDATGGRPRLFIRDEYLKGVSVVLQTLLNQSPQQSVVLFIDRQALPSAVKVQMPRTVQEFIAHHKRHGLIGGWLYSIRATNLPASDR